MNKTELVEVVASKAEITKVEAQKVVTATLDAIVGGIVKDGKVIRHLRNPRPQRPHRTESPHGREDQDRRDEGSRLQGRQRHEGCRCQEKEVIPDNRTGPYMAT